mmetsp:Transcript_26109/g.49029  ORF Transcript_26109/g.49029 Transcript_26109/m.49029 type:complete len:111 (+) Transcript_26109:966-1298(+)
MAGKNVLLGGIQLLCAENAYWKPLKDVANEWQVLEEWPGTAICEVVTVPEHPGPVAHHAHQCIQSIFSEEHQKRADKEEHWDEQIETMKYAKDEERLECGAWLLRGATTH